jgi:hypothetical protein
VDAEAGLGETVRPQPDLYTVLGGVGIEVDQHLAVLQAGNRRTTWLVVTRWRDEASFEAWLHSPAFGHGHRSAAERSGGPAPGPVGVSSELWSYEIAGGSAG